MIAMLPRVLGLLMAVALGIAGALVMPMAPAHATAVSAGLGSGDSMPCPDGNAAPSGACQGLCAGFVAVAPEVPSALPVRAAATFTDVASAGGTRFIAPEPPPPRVPTVG